MYKGKAIYNPSGKAGEYAEWACNFYVGCSNDCSYCYCKKGVLAHSMGGKTATLKKCFRDEADAMRIFKKELRENLSELQKHGLFFTFTSDPFLPECINLTGLAHNLCMENEVPTKFLTKKVGIWVDSIISRVKSQDNGFFEDNGLKWEVSDVNDYRKYTAFGFTLTGHDELEPGASTNAERIEAMRKLHDAGFKTFASIEPIIDFESSKRMIDATLDFCDLYKVGLMSGKKYDVVDAQSFVEWLSELGKSKIYLKESLQKLSLYTNEDFDDIFVSRDYNMFR